MRLDLSALKFLSKDEWRALTALEQGMRNHEFVPLGLCASIAKLRHTGMFRLLSNLLKYRLVAYEPKNSAGYRLTYMGYDYLAIHTLMGRGLIDEVGPKIGVGKEADVHVCFLKGKKFALKIHRLGRTSFRAVKSRRGYIRKGQSAHGWLYMSKLSATREYEYLKALKAADFPTPQPLDHNRHCVVMSFIKGTLLNKVRELEDPQPLLERLMGLIVQLAQSGIVHGDFNEFNLIMGKRGEKFTLIDFPQIIGVHHPNAEELFDRDVESIRALFANRFNYVPEDVPKFSDIVTPEMIQQSAAKKHLIQLEEYQELDDLLYDQNNQADEDEQDEEASEIGSSQTDSDATGDCQIDDHADAQAIDADSIKLCDVN